MTQIIKPFNSVGIYKLLSAEKTIAEQLQLNAMSFSKEVWSNDDCTVKVPWTVIKASNGLTYFFAKDKLFKINIQDGNEYFLRNGIAVGMDLMKAREMDNTLTYDEWNEDWSSKEGYWLEDSLKTKKVISITIFIKELLDDDLFERYEW